MEGYGHTWIFHIRLFSVYVAYIVDPPSSLFHVRQAGVFRKRSLKGNAVYLPCNVATIENNYFRAYYLNKSNIFTLIGGCRL